ncbi:MAG: primosomal protein N' [Patescibacteria group bacterium]
MTYADIAPNAKTSGNLELFTYAIPEELRGIVIIGQLVQIPLGPRTINGIVLAIHNTKPSFTTREIKKIIDEEPVLSPVHIEVARTIAQHFYTSLPLTLFHMLPPNVRKRKRKLSSVKAKKETHGQKFVINDLILNAYQKPALLKITSAIDKKIYTPFLLHGVTGSGKTEIYLRAMAHVLESGGQGIFIVPEISLTPQSIARFEQVFGRESVAVVHSQMTSGERLKIWEGIRDGQKKVVVGSRSALFAPLPNLKIIIVDEEHDLISFKSDQTPRYELHFVAQELAKRTGAALIFGSATPLVTSYQKVVTSEWEYLSLPERVDNKQLPTVKILNMWDERQHGNKSYLSSYLEESLRFIVAHKRQAIVFLNRRGASTIIRCQDCGTVSECEDCSVPLVYHMSNNKMWCHHCSRQYELLYKCKHCQGAQIFFGGRGTERVEMELKQSFPQAIIARMDRDTMEKGEDYLNIFESFKKGAIDIIVGTQMVVHGWDIPSVDLAAVISIDGPLLLPDYRSEEGVFQLLVQLAGRTGRGEMKGMLVVQTEMPDHFIFELARKGDYTGFATQELKKRELFGYPPFMDLVVLSYAHLKPEVAEKKAKDLKIQLDELKEKVDPENTVTIVGPFEPLVAKKYGKYLRTIVLKIRKDTTDQRYVVRDQLLKQVPSDWTIDVDPLSIL